MRLALLDAQGSAGPVDRVQRQGDDLAGAQAVIRHQVEDDVIAPALAAAPVDRGQQPADQRPVQGAGRLLTAVGPRRVDAVEPP